MKPRASLALILCLQLAFGAAAQGLPDLGDASVAALSESQERTIGNRIMREVRVDPLYVDDPEVADYVSALGARLLGGAEGPRRDLGFFVVQDDAVNAFALVGGFIGVHTGLVTLTQNESEREGEANGTAREKHAHTCCSPSCALSNQRVTAAASPSLNLSK